MNKESKYKIIYGPYGFIGCIDQTQINDSKNFFETFFELFFWSKKFVAALF